jgi:hypothetical protein
MQTKFKIVETEEYYLAVSDEKPTVANQFIYETDTKSINITCSDYAPNDSDFVIVAYLPKNNAPELLYDVKISSDENVNIQKVSRLPLLPKIVIEPKGFDEFQYTEQDLRKAFEFYAFSSISDQPYSDEELNQDFNNFKKSLNQSKTPTHFEAEISIDYVDGFTEGSARSFYGKPKLKTELINGKETLVGNYLFK